MVACARDAVEVDVAVVKAAAVCSQLLSSCVVCLRWYC